LHARLYGRGPTRAKTHIQREYVLTILEEVFTPAEQTLVRAGKGDQVSSTRAEFQDIVEDEFIAVVEAATGRPVRAFISQVHVGHDVVVEVFLFEDAHEDEGDARVADAPDGE
jgi:uncharacterized protein YbcI